MDETRQQGGCGPLAEARQAWNAVGVVAGQSEIIRNRVRPDPAALQQRLLVEHALADHVDLHHVVGLQALPEVLVRREDPHLVDLPGVARGGRGERIVGLEFAHRPHHRADRARRLFRGVELRAQVRRHPLVGLVVREEVVAERTDRIVEGDRHVRHLLGGIGEQRQQRLRQPPGRLERMRRPFRVMGAEELEGAVDDVQPHRPSIAWR